MIQLNFLNAVVEDNGNGLRVNGKDLNSIISAALGKSNTIRIDEHDQEIKENNNLIGAIKELATEVKYMRADLNDTIERLNKLEGKDSDKWEKFKWLLVAGLVTIVLGSLAVQVGLK